MKKTNFLICLGASIFVLASCANYSGTANDTVTHVYYAPETIDTYPAPPHQESPQAAQIETLRYQLFDYPTDHSNEWTEW